MEIKQWKQLVDLLESSVKAQMIQIHKQISRGMKSKCDHKNKRIFTHYMYVLICSYNHGKKRGSV